MIPAEVFSARRDQHCLKCDFWRGACLKGHNLSADEGCPIHKFEPVNGASYAQDAGTPMPFQTANSAGCCCGPKQEEMPEITWSGVLKLFASSMLEWIRTGAKLVSSEIHGERYSTCKECDRFHKFYCLDCRCAVYVKAKLRPAGCPRRKWIR